jgi:N-acetylmuramoyl-L-alanine amidase
MKKYNKEKEIGGLKASSLAKNNPQLLNILANLSTNANTKNSIKLGNIIIKQVKKIGKIQINHTRKESFVVLKSHETASVLIEIGFMSNKYDLENMTSLKFEKKLAKYIFNGMDKYSRSNDLLKAVFK